MKEHKWTDDLGYVRKRLLRDDDNPLEMRDKGISLDPPDVNGLDWEDIKRDLHNNLVARGLVTFEDVQQAQNGLTGAILGAMRSKLLALYRQKS